MNKKFILIIWMIMAFSQLVISQTPGISLIGTGGGTDKNGSVFLSYSFGEPFITYAQNSNHWLTEGFQQPGKISVTTSIDNLHGNTSLTVFPNPTTSELKVEWKDLPPCSDVQVRNVLGQKVHSELSISNENIVLSIDELQPGLYWISVQCGRMPSITKSFIKL